MLLPSCASDFVLSWCGHLLCCGNCTNFALVTPISCLQVVNTAVIVDPLSNQVIARACDEVCSWHTPKTEVGAECSSSPKSPAEMTGRIRHELCPQHCSSDGLEQVETSISCLHPRWWVDKQTCRSSLFWHPLRHAAIVAIESSAARDRCLFPDVRYEDEATKEECILSPAKSQAKRQKTDVTDVSFSFTCEGNSGKPFQHDNGI